jgi:hypothetical protein
LPLVIATATLLVIAVAYFISENKTPSSTSTSADSIVPANHFQPLDRALATRENNVTGNGTTNGSTNNQQSSTGNTQPLTNTSNTQSQTNASTYTASYTSSTPVAQSQTAVQTQTSQTPTSQENQITTNYNSDQTYYGYNYSGTDATNEQSSSYTPDTTDNSLSSDQSDSNSNSSSDNISSDGNSTSSSTKSTSSGKSGSSLLGSLINTAEKQIIGQTLINYAYNYTPLVNSYGLQSTLGGIGQPGSALNIGASNVVGGAVLGAIEGDSGSKESGSFGGKITNITDCTCNNETMLDISGGNNGSSSTESVSVLYKPGTSKSDNGSDSFSVGADALGSYKSDGGKCEIYDGANCDKKGSPKGTIIEIQM